MGSILAVLVFIFSPVIFAQTAQRPGAGKAATPVPDLSGVWGGHDNFFEPLPREQQSQTREELPLQPWASYNYKYNSQQPDGAAIGTARDEVRPWILCMPYGMPAGMFATEYFEIIQSPRRVLILLNGDHEVRQIWTDGRQHPKDPDPTWMGHSIGKWEGDTLVVDTIGITKYTWMNDSGIPHSDELHVVERFRRVTKDRLEIDYMFDDPKAFTKPWERKQVLELQPKNVVIAEENWDGNTPPIQNYFRCGENYDDWAKGRTFWLTK